jgi:hypothetical protein
VTLTQIALPMPVQPAEIQRKQSLGAAISLCVEASGLPLKAVLVNGRFDKGQFSRWESGAEGVCWPKLQTLMDVCGNDVPVLWQFHQRGYDLDAVRRRESDLERRLRLSEEENAALRRVLAGHQR